MSKGETTRMKLMSILSGKGFVMYNKSIAQSVSVNGAIIFGQLCSSYESFGSKNMLTVRNDKEYFFLTSDTINKETSLTYKQQLKAAKELEQAGFIESKLMGVPSKKFFHITNKIYQELILEGRTSSDKRADLKESTDSGLLNKNEPSSYDKRESLAMPIENGKHVQKGSTIKENNKKEQDKDNINFNCNFKEPDSDRFKSLLKNHSNDFYTKISIGRWNKKQWNTLVEKFVNDTIESGRYKKVPEHKIKGFAFKCLKKIADNSDYKHSDEFAEYQEAMREIAKNPVSTELPEGFYNWLEQE